MEKVGIFLNTCTDALPAIPRKSQLNLYEEPDKDGNHPMLTVIKTVEKLLGITDPYMWFMSDEEKLCYPWIVSHD